MRVTNDSFAPMAATRAIDQGLRMVVLVNDFGSININSALMKLRGKDTIELTNGCICCTISGDLFYAIGDTLGRRPRPDHVIVEATGISILRFPKHS
ncbi:hypothetical protein KUV33_23170 [Leisingera daeponensis]|nr:hypothetical protein [Leisingera daeponensis]